MKKPLDAAVLLIAFNRPETTRKVFEAIRMARPRRLYFAVDGPRSGRAGERELCEAVVRQAAVDWDCELKTLIRQENLGCREAVSSALDWFFEHEPEGIILEDDCLPSESFFTYCEELLERYREDERVWQVCGTAFVAEGLAHKREHAYLFSKYGPIWGWASWRRAWVHNDPKLAKWPEMKKEPAFSSAYPSLAERRARLELGERLYRGEIDTWDYQWGMVKNFNSGLSAVPCRNLVVNIGFGENATHTHGENPHAPRETRELAFPLSHPAFVLADREHDELYLRTVGIGATVSILRRLRGRLRSWIG